MLSTTGYSSYLSTGIAGLGKYLSSALAAIIYNMDTFNVDENSLRVIDNVGGTGYASDAPMYASNHIFLDGSTQSVDYVTVSGSDYVYFDVATKSHVKFTASAATATITDSHSNFFSLKGGASLTELDLSLLNLKPESIARLVDGETVSELSFDLTDIEAFYPGNEGDLVLDDGEFVHNVLTSLGTDIIEDTIGTYPNVVNADETTSLTVNTSSSVNLAVTSVGTVLNRPSLNFSALGAVDTKLYVVYVTVGVNSGTPKLYNAELSNTQTVALNETLITKTYSFIIRAARNGGLFSLHFDGRNLFNIDVSVVVEELVSYAEITNYTSTCRTNLDLQNYGASNLLYKQDATGRFTGMADAGTIVGASDGRNIDIQMTTPYNHLVTKDIDKIEGTLDSCTITYVDTTTEIVP